MLATIVALSLAATPSTAEGTTSAPTPANPSAADSVVAAAFTSSIGTSAPALQSSSTSSFAAPIFALVALAALAFALTRRRARHAHSISIVESTALGPKRSLVIADVMGERLVLGVSEAGIAVLSTRPAPPPIEQAFVVPTSTAPARRMGFFDRLFGRVPQTGANAAFEELLRDSVEDQELRAKLALGQRGIAP